MFNYIHRCGNSEAIERAAEEEKWLCLLVSNVIHNGYKQTAERFLLVSTQVEE